MEKTRIGNTHYWADLPSGSGFGQPVEIWQDVGLGQHEVMAVASDKYAAINIIEALIKTSFQ